MKFLHVVQCYHPAIGGVEWLAKKFSEQFVSRYQDEVTVYAAAADKPIYFWRPEGHALPVGVENIEGVKVRRFKLFRGLRFLRMLFAHGFHRFRLPYHDWARTIQLGPIIFGMKKAIAQSNVDLVLATSFPFMHMYYAVAGAKKAGIPVILLGAIHVADKWGYDRQMMYNAIQRADAYIALTTIERDHLVERGIRPEKIKVIGGGVEAADFLNADGAAIREQYGFGDDLVVVAMARQTVLKRLDTLIKAMPKVWQEIPHVRLLMAGSRTAYSAQLDQIIATFPPEQQAKITIVNDFPEMEKPGLLAAGDLFVHPSGNESFGIVFIEAWACGKPVVGARIGAIPSVIDDGKDGLLFTYEDPDSLAQVMLELLTDPERRAMMGESGRQKVIENYTWEIVADRLREAYLETIANFQK